MKTGWSPRPPVSRRPSTCRSARAAGARELRVEIRNIDYRIVVGFRAGELAAVCSVKAVCIRGAERPFEQLYRGEFDESIQVVQGDESKPLRHRGGVARAQRH